MIMNTDIKPVHLELVKVILKKHAPGRTVWAYGSRVSGKSRPQSDLDIVVFDADMKLINDLREAFGESDLPFSVDVMNWDDIPENFRENIRKQYIVLSDS